MNEEEHKCSYQCSECNKIAVLGPKDAVRCAQCGHRILYKVRSNQWTQYEAL
ncbi:DNA-directed RNA polymerases I, II, and III subunit RPABC4 [Nematocida major]|uniref:DNA-directed RNA polymerases I, II, and III subunit RPABC4 n=1 Tax=Nematocida major TaxID=1912982 RepID=UPI0020089933|nr:DNA-directed RNA polymerases I, II, and III subunit RPABC4 [Nematocida major]KAH9385118.1 DNA-directed RNA polymerases I, II, and III subunit RPABC4 [Nematocida major]